MKKKYFFPFVIAAAFLSFPAWKEDSFFTSIAEVIIKTGVPLPWAKVQKEHLPPSVPGKDYTPAVVPNGSTATYKVVDGVKVFHLTAEEMCWEVADGLKVAAWGFNGSTPGPLIEVAEGDKVRIYVTNTIRSPITLHWHGLLLPCGMDGVAGITQPPIEPNQTYVYEFYCPDSGTYMYHPHYNELVEQSMGLVGMFIVHKREPDKSKRPDRDFAIMLGECNIDVGTARPNSLSPEFNIFTMNGKVMPDTEPLVAEINDKVWIRFGNLSAMDNHPIHLHGYSFKTIGSGGGWAKDPSVLLPEATVLVPTGSTKVISFMANNPGDWAFHCHMTHHTMNQMGHKFPDTVGVDIGDFQERVQELIPDYKMLGTTGMKDMTKTGLPIPENSIPMLGLMGRWGNSTTFGGMANIFRVREKTNNYKDPGPYNFPAGTRAKQATFEQMQKDGIVP